MILLNTEQVLERLESIFAAVNDDMFDMSGKFIDDAEDYLPCSWSTMQKLYLIRDGINYVEANHSDADVRLSVTEIGLLDSVNITPDLAEHEDG